MSTDSLIVQVVLAVTLLKPLLLRTPNRLWTKFGLLLGRITGPIMLAIIFFAKPYASLSGHITFVF